jgi:transcriptional regulator with XRE-family HTH domain
MSDDRRVRVVRAVIREERVVCGYTQEELARRAGISLGTLRHLESGRNAPALATLFDLIDALDLSPLDFWERVEARLTD